MTPTDKMAASALALKLAAFCLSISEQGMDEREAAVSVWLKGLSPCEQAIFASTLAPALVQNGISSGLIEEGG